MRENCFHCGLPVSDDADFPVKIFNQTENMCCPGCQAVARVIVTEGLESYYNNRTELPPRPDEPVPDALRQFKLFDRDEVQREFVESGDGHKIANLILEGIVCAACAWLSESHVQKLPGVIEFKVNYSTHRARLIWNDDAISLSKVLAEIANIGYQAHPFDPNTQDELYRKNRQNMLRRLVVAGIGAMQVMMIASGIYLGAGDNPESAMLQFLRWISLLIATPVVLYSAQVFFIPSWRDLRAKTLGMDVPVTLAIIIAFAASAYTTVKGHGEIYFDSVTMFIFFLLIGRFLELSARHKAGYAIDSMLRLSPAIATRVRGEAQEEVPVIDLALGDTVLIKPGSRVPADGEITEGESSVNESMLSGESLPLLKRPGDKLIGGTTNIESPLLMKVEKLGADTVLSSILRLLQEAEASKPKISIIANKLAAYFVGFILLLAAITLFYWYQVEPARAFPILISVLVVTCPCALSLATPAAITVATGKLGQNGILTTSANALEQLANITDIVFDKTGTLTGGEIELTAIENFTDFSDKEILKIAGSLEQRSEHPIARAFHRLDLKTDTLTQVKVASGRGVEARIADRKYRIGKLDYVKELIRSDFTFTEPVGAEITVYLADENKLLATFKFSDRVRFDAVSSIKALQQQKVETHLFSGDKQKVAAKIGEELGIYDVKGEMMPEHKLAELAALQNENKIVAMVGDGVNDAPVLRGADVSIAMGQGSELARVNSDMVLFSNKLEHLPLSVKITRVMLRIIKQNIIWAILYNIIALPLAIAGHIEPWMAAIGMSLSSLLVVLNALRIKNL